MPRLPFFPENRFRRDFEPRHQWPEQGNRLRWVWLLLSFTVMFYTLIIAFQTKMSNFCPLFPLLHQCCPKYLRIFEEFWGN